MFDYRRVSDVQPHDGHISLPALQWRQGSICPSCGRGRMHSGGEHEWQMQRPHLRQWCFLRSNQKSAWVMWQVQRHTGDAHLNGGVFFWGNEAKPIPSTLFWGISSILVYRLPTVTHYYCTIPYLLNVLLIRELNHGQSLPTHQANTLDVF